MNSTKKNSEFGGVKKKLTAAIAMLLVATIMMVSSTYAWFTLSTAPEVTGITTSVGANGNLEMALTNRTTFISPDDIKSNVGDSTSATVTKNLTWGNLVDLSDEAYGLEGVKLNPARLNVSGDADAGYVVQAAPLATPEYGADGRVSQLVANTSGGAYNGTDGTYSAADEPHGVLAIGNASGMSVAQIDMRNAKSAVSTNMMLASNKAAQTLNTYGAALGQIAINQALNGKDSFAPADMKAVSDTIDGLEKAVGYIESALKNAVIAYATTQKSYVHLTTESVSFTSGEGGAKITVAGQEVSYAGAASDAVAAYLTLVSNVSSAKNSIPATADSYTWEQIKTPLEKVMNPANMKLNGYTISQAKGDQQSAFISSVMGNGLRIAMPTGSGAFADVADFTGSYSANVTIKQVDYETIHLKDVGVSIEAQTTRDAAYLVAISTALKGMNAQTPDGDTSTTNLTDFYGYSIDLAFRTNAADSKLRLQTEAANRIYSGEQNEEVMGNGCTMTFKSTSTTFTDTQVKSLMQAIRVVFMDSDRKVLGVATLDEDTAVTTAAGIQETLTLKNYTIADGKITIGETDRENQELVSLTQNKAKVITALVFLDGDKVENKDVANAAQSMSGTLNLQFSSTATLTPMDYTPLKQSNSTGTNGQGGN